MSDEPSTSIDASFPVPESTDRTDHGQQRGETEGNRASTNSSHRLEAGNEVGIEAGNEVGIEAGNEVGIETTTMRSSRADPAAGGNSRFDSGHGPSGGSHEGISTDGDGGVRRPNEQGEDAPQFREWCRDASASLADSDDARIDVYVRSMLPSPGAKSAQMNVLDNLSALCDETAIDETSVHVWGERICLCDTCRESDTGALMIDTVREFENWGRDYDASAEAFFEHTHQKSSLVEDTYDGIVPPRITVAFYVDGALQGVFPSRFGDEPYSITDFYRSLYTATGANRSGDPAETRSDQGAVEPTH